MRRRDGRVPTRRGYRDKNVEVALLGDTGYSKNSTVLLTESTAFVDNHLEGILPV
jgi:hypothetical protein